MSNLSDIQHIAKQLGDNPFIWKTEAYKRDLDIVRHYKEDTSYYISKMSGQPLSVCRDYVERNMAPGGKFEFQDPNVYYLHRQENGDRKKKVIKFSQYLGEAIRNRELIAATFTTYVNPAKKQSLLVDYIDDNVKARSRAKKVMFEAQQMGNEPLRVLKKIEQNNRKIRNNSISGSHVTPSTPMYNSTGHSTLTSTCRVTSGYGNVNNEKFVAGNRHYWCPDITINNIVSLAANSDYEKIQHAIDKFGLVYPTVEQTIACIRYSTKLYWFTKRFEDKVDALIMKLTPLERAAVVYTGDMYHLMLCNEQVIRTFLDRLSAKVETPHQDPDAVFKEARTDYVHLAASICRTEMAGKKLDKIKGTHEYGVVAATTVNIVEVLEDYRDLINAFWVTNHVPASVARLPDSIRRVALVSDTDSTIFTVQDWVIWHQGRPGFDQACYSIAAVMIFLAAQTVTHLLAKMSANFGIEQKRLYQIAMKNEYKFDVFVPTQVAKHYYATITAQEGDIMDLNKLKREIKGVHLKSSNVSKKVMKLAEEMMNDIMDTVMAEKQIVLADMLKRVADVERMVIDTIKRGDEEFFKNTQIKPAATYGKPPEQSPFQHHLFWQEVFAPKYGEAEEPPYAVLKISVDLSSATKMRAWIDGFKDRELAARMTTYCTKNGKQKTITTFQLPQPLIATVGIPPEIFEMIDYRRIVLDTTKVFYLILETLGYACLDNKITRLVSDFY